MQNRYENLFEKMHANVQIKLGQNALNVGHPTIIILKEIALQFLILSLLLIKYQFKYTEYQSNFEKICIRQKETTSTRSPFRGGGARMGFGLFGT